MNVIKHLLTYSGILFYFTLSGQTLNSITILPLNSNVAVSNTRNLKAIGTYSNGTSADITNLVVWTSLNTAAITVSNATGSQGVITGVQALNFATITATLGMISGSTFSFVGVDVDNDMTSDHLDNCKYIYNSTQVDSDGDGIGDVCDCQFNQSDPTQRTVQNIKIFAFPSTNINFTTQVSLHSHLTYINMPSHDPQPTYDWKKNNMSLPSSNVPFYNISGLIPGDMITCTITNGSDCVANGMVVSDTITISGTGNFVGINTATPVTELDINGGLRTKYSGTHLDNNSYTANSGIQTINIPLSPPLPAGWTSINTVALVSNVGGIECQIVQTNITNSNTLRISFIPVNSGSNPRFNYVILKL